MESVIDTALSLVLNTKFRCDIDTLSHGIVSLPAPSYESREQKGALSAQSPLVHTGIGVASVLVTVRVHR